MSPLNRERTDNNISSYIKMAKHPKLAGAMISFQSKHIPGMSKIQVAVVVRRVV